MARVLMYTTEWCGYCVRAKALLEDRGIEYEEVHMDGDPEFRQKLLDMTGRWTVPQIFVDGRPIGGYTELWALDRAGGLEGLAA
jgi:glutaredoxin 3